eukprot:TRINITY_DN22972_c0_g1_i1.p1 TRINITY_DN22972_c0_g1~~TRINITY_DN22972_c0_g1_i1.p1  ORF type:complete len:556 (+),score=23.62 TRINITY_DN22972_c0_g1_i1:87-1754(+)
MTLTKPLLYDTKALPSLEVDVRAASYSARVQHAWLCLSRWWAVTTHESYLTSNQSNRTSWSWVFPYCSIAYIAVLATDFFFADLKLFETRPVTWTVLIVSFPVVARLPASTLLPDIILICPCILCSCALVDALSINSIGAFIVPFSALSQSSLGIHSVVVACFCIVMGIYVVTREETTMFLAGLVTNALAFSIVATTVNQYYNASLHLELNAQLVTSQRLLDIATDGVCRIDTATATIISASRQFMRTFANDDIVGAPLEDLLGKDDVERFKSDILKGVGSSITEYSPLIATCYQNSKDPDTTQHVFEARFVLYASSSNHVDLFLNVVGELRSLDVSLNEQVTLTQPDDLEQMTSASHVGRVLDSAQTGASMLSELSFSLALSESTIVDTKREQVGACRTRTTSLKVSTNSTSTQTDFRSAKPPRPPPRYPRVKLCTSRVLAPQFMETPLATVQQMILTSLARINPRGKGCCRFHVRLESLLQRTSELLHRPCHMGPCLSDAWQCGECLVIQYGKNDEESYCDFCGAEHDFDAPKFSERGAGSSEEADVSAGMSS